MSAAESYARWVLDPSNAIRTGRLIKLAAQRFLRDLERTDIYFDEEEAIKCVNFIERYCVQWEGAWRGQPFSLTPWQKFALGNIYGWLKKNGKRRFTKAYIQISKKNGKSSLSAGISLFHLLADERINTPKVFTAANNELQAKICVNMAGRIVEQSDELREICGDIRLMRYKENITEVLSDDHARGSGFIKALAKEGGDKTAKTAGGKHGINASLGVVDEFGMSPDHGASKAIDSSMVSRPERLMLYITTAGYNLEGPCYKELRDSGIKVLEGVIEMDSYFMMIFEIDKPIIDGKEGEITIDWLLEHEEVWEQSNPNLDVSVERDALRDTLKEAQQYGGQQEADAKTLNFNEWVNSASAFISADKWNRNTHGIHEDDLIGATCFGGIEIVSGLLMNSFALYFPDVHGHQAVKMFYWMPSEAAKKQPNANDWERQGWLKVFAGDVADNNKVFNWLNNELDKYNMHSLSYRSNLASNDIVQALANYYQSNPISHGRQGIGTPTNEWEALFNAGAVEHFNNPILAWNNSNCMAIRKENDIRIEKSGHKVVGVYAGINALAQAMTMKQNSAPIDIVIL